MFPLLLPLHHVLSYFCVLSLPCANFSQKSSVSLLLFHLIFAIGIVSAFAAVSVSPSFIFDLQLFFFTVNLTFTFSEAENGRRAHFAELPDSELRTES